MGLSLTAPASQSMGWGASLANTPSSRKQRRPITSEAEVSRLGNYPRKASLCGRGRGLLSRCGALGDAPPFVPRL